MPLLLFAGAAVLVGGGFFVDKTGEAANDAANASIKIAVAAGVGYVIAKKLKVL